jgi:hypothetical protein
VFETALKWSELDAYGETELSRFINEHVAYPQRFGHESTAVAHEILQHYGHNRGDKSQPQFFAYQYNQLCGDLMFGMPALIEAKLKAKHQWPIFMFLHDYINPEAIQPELVKIHRAFIINLMPTYKLKNTLYRDVTKFEGCPIFLQQILLHIRIKCKILLQFPINRRSYFPNTLWIGEIIPQSQIIGGINSPIPNR